MTIIEATTRISLRNILFATDFSQYSTAALPYAVSLAAKHGAKVLAAHIAPAPVPAHVVGITHDCDSCHCRHAFIGLIFGPIRGGRHSIRAYLDAKGYRNSIRIFGNGGTTQ